MFKRSCKKTYNLLNFDDNMIENVCMPIKQNQCLETFKSSEPFLWVFFLINCWINIFANPNTSSLNMQIMPQEKLEGNDHVLKKIHLFTESEENYRVLTSS